MKKALIFAVTFLISCAVNAQIEPSTLKKATLVWWPNLEKNVFTENNTFLLLKEKLAARGYILETKDKHPPEKSDLILVAYPHYTVPEGMQEKSFLWLMESPIGVQIPPQPENEKRYKKIFTYNEPLAKKSNYTFLPISYEYKPLKKYDASLKKVLIAQVAGYHTHNDPKNIYSKRSDVITWFLKHHSDDILFAGHGNWKKDFRKTLSSKQHPLFDQKYKGAVKDKLDFLSQAKFGLAYENAQFNGYVSEKIYDVMVSGTVPVYLGAPDIEKYVPKACFVNQDHFKSYEELYDFLKNMSDEKYQSYINCIHNFMSDFQKNKNSPEKVSDKLIFEMLDKDAINETVEIHPSGGMGNQMFQYAAAFAYAKKHRKEVYIPKKNALSKHFNISGNIINDNTPVYSHQSEDIQKELSAKKGWHRFNDKIYQIPNFVHLGGYMQSEKFFSEVKDDIRKEFTFSNPPDDKNKKIIEQMHQENSVCLHIRRGDYIGNGYPLLTQKYYDNAIQYIKERDPDPMHVYVFSNDIKKAKNIFHTQEQHTFVHNKKDIEDLRLMTHCRHNIIANSTFSWWGAYLNPNPNKIVVMPDKWDYRYNWWLDEIALKDWVKQPAHDVKGQKVAILYIATGRYIQFWDEFYPAMEKYFLPNHKKSYFVFTDDIEKKFPNNVFRIPQKQLPWPQITLQRYRFFSSIKEKLKKFDYIYFLNANLIPQRMIDEKIFPSKEQGVMFTYHPGFKNKKNPDKLTYDRNPKSTAYIPFGEGRIYVMGGFNGGRKEDFLKMSDELSRRTDIDSQNNIIARWHDESHLNRYLVDLEKAGQKPLVLDSIYAVPEEYLHPNTPPPFASVHDYSR